MSSVWCYDGVVQSQSHGGMHDHVREGGGAEPGGRVGVDPVRPCFLGVVRCGRDGVEAQRQLLVDRAVRVEENVRGVAVDAGEPGQRKTSGSTTSRSGTRSRWPTRSESRFSDPPCPGCASTRATGTAPTCPPPARPG